MRNFKNSFYLLVAFTLIIFSNQSIAQSRKSFQKYSTIGIGAGTSHYIGDLAPYSAAYMALYSNVRFNAGLNFETYLKPNFSTRVSATFIRLYGNDATFGGADNFGKGTNKLRNLHFRNDMVEFSAQGIYNFIPFSDKRKGTQVSPYIGAGIALLGHSPKAKAPVDLTSPIVKKWSDSPYLKQENNNLNEDGTVKTYGSIAFAVPVSVGIKAKLNPRWTLGLDASYRLALTNYLDDVGKNYYNLDPQSSLSYRAAEDYNAITGKPRIDQYIKAVDAIGSNPGGIFYPSNSASNIYSDSQIRGTNAFKLDSYITTQISISYNISSRVKCPPIK